MIAYWYSLTDEIIKERSWNSISPKWSIVRCSFVERLQDEPIIGLVVSFELILFSFFFNIVEPPKLKYVIAEERPRFNIPSLLYSRRYFCRTKFPPLSSKLSFLIILLPGFKKLLFWGFIRCYAVSMLSELVKDGFGGPDEDRCIVK